MKYKRLIALLTALFLLLPMAGCEQENTDARLYFELPDVPAALDPQTASTASELILVRNLYEGLLRKNVDGDIVPGVAERYELSGLTYIFYLREDAHWDSGEPLTADDFVFGLQRAVDPATASPHAQRLNMIGGAAAILAGKADVSTLNVRAADAHTLTVTLTRSSADFPELLTTAPCMPCHRAFFDECVGKYGLDRKTVLCNGSYYLAKWNQLDFGIRLKKNAEYYGDFSAKNAEVFLSCSDDGNALRALTDGDMDLALLSGSDAETAEEKGFRTATVENICWVLTIGMDYSPEMRRAFARSVNREAMVLPSGFRAANSLFPSIFQIDGADGAGIKKYDLTTAKETFRDALENTEDGFPKTTLYYNETANPDIRQLINSVVGHWQQHLNAFINTAPAKDPQALTEQLKKQTLQMAVFPLTATDSNLRHYLDLPEKGKVNAAAIQKRMLEDDHVIPLAFETTCLSYSSALDGVILEPGNGTVDFSQITKKD